MGMEASLDKVHSTVHMVDHLAVEVTCLAELLDTDTAVFVVE